MLKWDKMKGIDICTIKDIFIIKGKVHTDIVTYDIFTICI